MPGQFRFLDLSRNNSCWLRVVFSSSRIFTAAVFPILNVSASFLHPNVGFALQNLKVWLFHLGIKFSLPVTSKLLLWQWHICSSYFKHLFFLCFLKFTATISNFDIRSSISRSFLWHLKFIKLNFCFYDNHANM